MSLALDVQLIALDENLAALGRVVEYDGLVWTARMLDHSEFSLQTADLSFLADAKYLIRSDAPEVMKVESLSFDGKKWELSGREATCLFEWRVVYGGVKFTTNTTVTNVANALFAKAFGDAGTLATSAERTLANYQHVALTSDNALTVGDGYTRSWGSLWERLQELLAPRFWGLRTIFNTTTTKLNAEIIEPTIASGVVFSVSMKDVIGFKRDIALSEFYTRALIAGEGEGDARLVELMSSDGYLVNDDTGFDAMLFPEWRELYVDAKDLQSVVDGVTLSEAEYRNALKQRGLEKLLESKYTNSLTVAVDESRYVYRTDYGLGSIVGYRVDDLFEGYDMISEVTETIEKGVRSIELNLGKTAPTLRQLVRSK